MPAKHSRNGRSARQSFSPDNALLLLSPPARPPSALSNPDELTVPYSQTPETASNDSPAPTLSLIDFGQASPAHLQAPLEVVDALEEEFVSGHRSPPFIQAQLPPIDNILGKDAIVHSPQPLPTRPRHSFTDPAKDASLAGHIRSPILAREQSALQSFSRTLRTYIPVPRSAPSPPLVSRPVSFGSFSASPHLRSPAQGHHHGYEDQDRVPRTPAQEHVRGAGTTSSGLARALQYGERTFDTLSPVQHGMSYPGSDATHLDPILWARWDRVHERRLLILAYRSGFQLWDCTNLGSVNEVLNLNTVSPEWLDGGEVVHVAVLPSPSTQVVQRFGDPFAADRPLIGVVMNMDGQGESSSLFIYSLSRHYLIKQVPLSGLAVTFQANANFLVISITNPPTLQIYSPSTFKEIHTIHSNSLVPFSHSPVLYSNIASKLFTTGTGNNNKGNNDAVFLGQGINASEASGNDGLSPRPVFALSHRLLAYASPPSFGAQQAHRSSSRGSRHSSAASPSTSPFGIGGLNMQMTQAEIGNAALKVGGSLLSGMKTLGGIALTAAKNRIVSDTSSSPHFHSDFSAAPPGRQQARHSKYVSTSAPSNNNLDGGPNRRERRYSTTSSTESQESTGRSYSGSEQVHTSPVIPTTSIGPEQGSYVTIVDLGPLLADPSQFLPGEGIGSSVLTIAEFFVSRTQPIAGLYFSNDGCSVVVVPANGQVVQVFQIRPTPSVLRKTGGQIGTGGTGGIVDQAKASREPVVGSADVTMRMYRLHRGRSHAVVDNAAWASDGRWAAIGTLRPTIHVFAVNPYGGKPDLKSHTKGRVFNVNELQPPSVEITALVRLRALKPSASDKPGLGLAFTFIDCSEACLPTSLLPTTPVPGHVVGSPEVGPSPHHRPRPTNYQDMLVFDPNDGILSLRRITTEVRSKDQGLSVAASMSMGAAALGATSISLPGLGGAGKLSMSSSPSPSSVAFSVSSSASGRQGALVDINATHELIAKDAVVATWNLQRTSDWKEIRQPIEMEIMAKAQTHRSTIVQNYLAHAELSTFSRSPRILPRSIYLSHQFSFFSLGEDYHALIRRSQLDIVGHKIDVRKEVLASAFPSTHGASESFVEGFPSSSSRDSQRHSASFDEHLATALAGGIEYNTLVVPPVLPMYPNGGTAGTRPRPSFRNPIPIRTIGDGMSESLSRLRREINKVRSPHLLPRTEGSSSPGLVPLEFDEEDEDFLSRDSEFEGVPEPAVVPVPEPPLALVDREDDTPDDASSGWDLEDRQAVEDEERFHDLVVPGLIDQEAIGVVKRSEENVRTKKKGKGKRR